MRTAPRGRQNKKRYNTTMHEDEQDTPGVSIHAGFPNPAADKSLTGLDLHQLLVQRTASTYIFRIRGDAWQNVGISDGDIAVVDRALSPRPTDLVVWWHGVTSEFAISHPQHMPAGAEAWGVVTSTIHQFRKGDQ